MIATPSLAHESDLLLIGTSSSTIIFSSILVLSSLATFASAAPASNYSRNPVHRRQSPTCTMTGEYETSVVIGSGGPGQGPIDSSSGDLQITIGPDNMPVTDTPIVTNSIDEQAQTYTSDQTGLQNPIQWSANFNVGYSACFVTYEGTQYTGGPVTPSGGESAGESKFACAVSFPC
ncbi:hypothetical protein N431DRAFT_461109 [Stipitochalara longipes BDJ]|nr:hypothetical protein N431DRAFT_461109 [Stipitochalara longipes BDJ]